MCDMSRTYVPLERHVFIHICIHIHIYDSLETCIHTRERERDTYIYYIHVSHTYDSRETCIHIYICIHIHILHSRNMYSLHPRLSRNKGVQDTRTHVFPETYTHIRSHTYIYEYMSVERHICARHVTHMNESCHTYECTHIRSPLTHTHAFPSHTHSLSLSCSPNI